MAAGGRVERKLAIELGAVRVALETGAARTRPAVVSGLEIVEEISGEERQRAARAKQRVLGRVHIAPGVSAVVARLAESG